MTDRTCVVCQTSQKGKRAWEYGVGKRVICYGCGVEWTLKIDGKTATRRTVRAR